MSPLDHSPAFLSSIAIAKSTLRSTCVKNHLCLMKAQDASPPNGNGNLNPFGIQAFVYVGTWATDDARKAISSAATAGFGLVEIPLMGPPIDTKMTRNLLREYDMKASCSLGLSLDTDISSEDKATVRRGEDVLNLAVDSAAEIGSSFVGGVLYSMLGKYNEKPTEKGLWNSAEVLGRVCERAAKAGINIGLEPCNRYETNVANTALEIRQHMKRFGDPANCFVHLDTYHMHIEEVYENAVKDCGEKLGYLHVGDSQRGYLGSGNVDFGRIFRALARARYQGPLVFESFNNTIVDKNITKALAIWREMWSDPDDLAKRARQFLQSEWTTALKTVEKERESI